MRALVYSFGLIIIALCLIVTSCGGTQDRKAYDDGYRDGVEFIQQSIQTPSQAGEWLELYPDFNTFYAEHHQQRPFDESYNQGFYDVVSERCRDLIERSGG